MTEAAGSVACGSRGSHFLGGTGVGRGAVAERSLGARPLPLDQRRHLARRQRRSPDRRGRARPDGHGRRLLDLAKPLARHWQLEHGTTGHGVREHFDVRPKS